MKHQPSVTARDNIDVMANCCEHCPGFIPTPPTPLEFTVSRFIAEATNPNPDAITGQDALYSAYVKWCGSGIPAHRNRFGIALNRLGVPSTRSASRRYRTGLELS